MPKSVKAIAIVSVLSVTGCINSATRTEAPLADLTQLKTFYVEHFPNDGRGLDALIAKELTNTGHPATSGSKQPSGVNAVVTYRDKWRWDLSIYMLSIAIKIRDPETGFPLAECNSLHTSLTRQTPEEMIRECLGNIFDPVVRP